MTKLLSIIAPPDAPIACDMTEAQDTLVERLAEYRRLFEHALVSRTSTEDGTTFRFSARPGVSEWVLDLVPREAACCPFLSYEVDHEDDEIVWITRGIGASDWAVLEEFLSDTTAPRASSTAIAEQLGARGGIPIIVPAGNV